MNDVRIGRGKLFGKGVYANRNFKKGEVVIKYHLKPLTKEEYDQLPKSEKPFTHIHWGIIHLYSVPERYVNHSKTPNTTPNLVNQADVAIKDIAAGEAITTNASLDDV